MKTHIILKASSFLFCRLIPPSKIVESTKSVYNGETKKYVSGILLIYLLLSLYFYSTCTSQKVSFIDTHNSFHSSVVDSTLAILDTLDMGAYDELDQALIELYRYHAHRVKEYNDKNESLLSEIILKNPKLYNDSDKALYNLYKGRLLAEEQEYGLAIQSFHKSEQYALKSDNSHVLGFVYLRLAALFNDLLLNNTALRYNEMSISSFSSAGDMVLANRAKGNLGIVHMDMRDYNAAELYYVEAKAGAIMYSDMEYLRHIIHWYLYDYLYNHNIPRIKSLYADLVEFFRDVPASVTENLALVCLYIAAEEYEEALTQIESFSESFQTELDEMLYHKVLSYIHYCKGSYETSVVNYRKYISIYDGIDFYNNRSHLVSLEAKRESLGYKLIAHAERKQKKLIIICSGLSLIILILILLRLYNISRQRKIDLENRLSVIAELGKSNETLSEKLDLQKENELELKKILEGQLEYHKQLLKNYAQYSHRPDLFIGKIDKLLNKYSLGKNSYANLVNIINTYYNDALNKLQEENPILNEIEIVMCGLMLAGFSPQEMCIIMDYKSMEVIYTKRYRIKQKIGLDKVSSIENYLESLL